LEKTSADNTDKLDPDSEREDLSSPGSRERKEKKVFFLTKSMAEVYTKQNHISMALEVYRRMRELNPADSDIGKRMVELEEGLLSKRGIRFKEQNT
jgi:pentatricopeptide repeat protein